MSAIKNLRVNLKRLRREQLMTQQSLAEKAGLDYKHYQRIEAGHWSGVQLRTVEVLAKALKVEAAELLRRH